MHKSKTAIIMSDNPTKIPPVTYAGNDECHVAIFSKGYDHRKLLSEASLDLWYHSLLAGVRGLEGVDESESYSLVELTLTRTYVRKPQLDRLVKRLKEVDGVLEAWNCTQKAAIAVKGEHGWCVGIIIGDMDFEMHKTVFHEVFNTYDLTGITTSDDDAGKQDSEEEDDDTLAPADTSTEKEIDGGKINDSHATDSSYEDMDGGAGLTQDDSHLWAALKELGFEE